MIKSGVRKSKGECPGEEDCSKFKSSIDNKKELCEKCPVGVGPMSSVEEIEGGQAILPLVNHILWLDQLKSCGMIFQMNDLTMEEWQSLLLLNHTRNKVETELMEKEKAKNNLKSLMRESKTKRS